MDVETAIVRDAVTDVETAIVGTAIVGTAIAEAAIVGAAIAKCKCGDRLEQFICSLIECSTCRDKET